MRLMSHITKNKYGIYYVRLVVPKHLRAAIGKTELKESLGTKYKNEASHSALPVLANFNEQIRVAQRAIDMDATVTYSDIKNAVLLWKNDQIGHFDDADILSCYIRKEPITDSNGDIKSDDWYFTRNTDAFELCRERSLEAQNIYSDPYNDFNYTSFRPKLGDALEQYMVQTGTITDVMQLSNLWLLKTNPLYIDLIKELAIAYWDVTEAAMRLVGNNAYNAHNNLPQLTYNITIESSIPSDNPRLSALFNEYKQANGTKHLTKETIDEYALSIKRFIAFLGDLNIKTIQKSHVAEFKSKLEQLPNRPSKKVSSLSPVQQIEETQQNNLRVLSAGTVKKQIRGLSAILTYAYDMGLLDDNPATDIRFQPERRTLLTPEANKNFTRDEINIIFNSGIFTHKERPKIADYGEAHYWIPLIFYYTGARVEEIAQLHIDDIQQRNNIWFIRISEEHDDQRVKTGNSLREVPIHQHLIELGLLDYKSSLPPHGRLFPHLREQNGKYSTAIAKWWGKYLRGKLKLIREGIKPFHSFRHTFITLCRENDSREDVQNAIVGHSQSNFSSSNTGRQYGNFSLEIKKSEIDKIPMLDINTSVSTEDNQHEK